MKQGGVLDSEGLINYKDWHKENSGINVAWRNTPDGSGVELVWTNSLGMTWPVSSIGQVGTSDVTSEDDQRRIVLSWDDLNSYIHAQKNYQIREANELETDAATSALEWRGYK